MRVTTPEEGWDWLAEKTQGSPLFPNPTTCGTNLHGTVIRENRWGRFIAVGLMVGLAIGAFCTGAVPAQIVGLVLLALAALASLYRQHILCDPYAGVLTVVRGLAGWERSVALPRDRLMLTETVVGGAEDGGDARPAGGQVLRLTHAARPGRVDIMMLPDGRDLPPAARALTEFLAGHVTDATTHLVELEDGSYLEVPGAPTTTTWMPGRVELDFVDQRHAVITPGSPAKMVIGEATDAIVTALIVVGIGAGLVSVPLFSIVGLPILGLSVPVVAFLIWSALSGRRIRTDLQEGVLRLEGFRKRLVREWPLADVAGVQLCAFHVHEAPPGHLCHEVNAVFRPKTERVRLWASDDRESTAREARRFAAFLGKPFWDHT